MVGVSPEALGPGDLVLFAYSAQIGASAVVLSIAVHRLTATSA